MEGVQQAGEFLAHAGGGAGDDVDFPLEGARGEGGGGEGRRRGEGLGKLVAHGCVYKERVSFFLSLFFL